MVRGKAFFRLAFFVPYAIPGIIAALLWGYLYDPSLSPIVKGMQALGLPAADFLGRSAVLWFSLNEPAVRSPTQATSCQTSTWTIHQAAAVAWRGQGDGAMSPGVNSLTSVDGDRLPGGWMRGARLVAGAVHRRHGANSAFVHGLLRWLEEAGFDGAPRFLGDGVEPDLSE